MSSLQKFHRRTNPFKVNTLHTGTVSITGTVQVGSILTATNNIADVDGLGTFVYQWKRSGTAISGAVASTYTLVSADVGNTIAVTITYTDGKGFTETGTSKLIVAPSSAWRTGVFGTRSLQAILSDTDGLTNTNSWVALVSTIAAAPTYARSLSTGGYNTWYLPAKNEVITMITNRNATPFATSGNSWVGKPVYTSTAHPSDGGYVYGTNSAGDNISWLSKTSTYQGGVSDRSSEESNRIISQRRCRDSYIDISD